MESPPSLSPTRIDRSYSFLTSLCPEPQDFKSLNGLNMNHKSSSRQLPVNTLCPRLGSAPWTISLSHSEKIVSCDSCDAFRRRRWIHRFQSGIVLKNRCHAVPASRVYLSVTEIA